jgi:hypothetical protein
VRELTEDELVKLPMQALLVRLGRMSLDQLAEALRENVATGQAVDEIAISRGWVAAAEIAHLRAAKQALGAPVETAAPAQATAPSAPATTQAAPAPTYASFPLSAPQQPASPQPPEPQPAPPPPPSAQPPQPAAAHAAPAPRSDDAAAVFIALQGGHRVRVGPFTSMDECERRTQEVVEVFNRPEPGIWPRFGNRFVRPDAVTAIEISRRRDD